MRRHIPHRLPERPAGVPAAAVAQRGRCAGHHPEPPVRCRRQTAPIAFYRQKGMRARQRRGQVDDSYLAVKTALASRITLKNPAQRPRCVAGHLLMTSGVHREVIPRASTEAIITSPGADPPARRSQLLDYRGYPKSSARLWMTRSCTASLRTRRCSGEAHPVRGLQADLDGWRADSVHRAHRRVSAGKQLIELTGLLLRRRAGGHRAAASGTSATRSDLGGEPRAGRGAD